VRRHTSTGKHPKDLVVTTVGVEERVWRHTRFGDKGDKYVTVIIDLTPARTKTEHVEVEATWGIYQRMIAAYQNPAGESTWFPHGRSLH
jgi:hypothetical protein